MIKMNLICYFDVKNSNPNGDPDLGNQPRTLSDGSGLITDVCLKRKIRNYVSKFHKDEEGYDIFLKKGENLEDKNKKEDLSKIKEDDKKKNYLCHKYFDVRMFGLVNSVSNATLSIRGASQFSMSTSIDPVNISDNTITVCFGNKTDTKQNMGTKSFIEYGLYQLTVNISGIVSEENGVSEKDINVLIEALRYIFENDDSSARNEICMRKIVIFSHELPQGNCSLQKLKDCIKFSKVDGIDEPMNYSDYLFSIDEEKLKTIKGISYAIINYDD